MVSWYKSVSSASEAPYRSSSFGRFGVLGPFGVLFTLSNAMLIDAVVIWGEFLWDRFSAALGGDRLGGAPVNVAWHLAQVGGWAQLVTRVGDDADGRRALAELDD